MKTPNPKQETRKIGNKKINLEKFIPYVVLLSFLIMGAVLIAFGYFIFNREPEASVISSAEQELAEISMQFNKDKIEDLFDSSYSTSDVKAPPFQPKNPFKGF